MVLYPLTLNLGGGGGRGGGGGGAGIPFRTSGCAPNPNNCQISTPMTSLAVVQLFSCGLVGHGFRWGSSSCGCCGQGSRESCLGHDVGKNKMLMATILVIIMLLVVMKAVSFPPSNQHQGYHQRQPH